MKGEADDITLVDKFLHIFRDFSRLLRNFVTFQDFYDKKAGLKAVFQCGTLLIDQRACHFCMKVADMGKHNTMAPSSGMYLLYCDCTAKDKAGKQVFALCNEAYYSAHSNANLTMKMEQLYGVYNSSYQDDIYKAYYSKANPLFTQNENYVKTAYESTLYPDDIRFKSSRYWKSQMADNAIITEYHFLKYAFNGSWYGYNTVPVMRLSEMYFILFECASIADMKPYFATWRLSRGLDASIDASLTTESAVVSRMEKEWRKEFMGEGQMFFFYKKHNYQAYTWPTAYTVPTGAYQLPKPKSQTMYE